jgi:hypothetical protein
MPILYRYIVISLVIQIWLSALPNLWVSSLVKTSMRLIYQPVQQNFGGAGIFHSPAGFVIIYISPLAATGKGNSNNIFFFLPLCSSAGCGTAPHGSLFCGVPHMGLGLPFISYGLNLLRASLPGFRGLWIFFRADSYASAVLSIKMIFANMDLHYLLPFIKVRSLFCVLLITGFAIHFIPDSFKGEVKARIGRTPLLVKALMLVIVIQVILQIRLENVQPFIYFQF